MVGQNNPVGRPKLGKHKRVRVSFTLPPAIVDWLEKTAKKERIGKSTLLDRILTRAQHQELKNGTTTNLATPRIPIPESDVAALCKRYQVSKLSLFGSILTDAFTEESDIDLLVEFQPDSKPTLFTISAMKQEFEDIFARKKIDLLTRDELSPYFREDVLENAFPIYSDG